MREVEDKAKMAMRSMLLRKVWESSDTDLTPNGHQDHAVTTQTCHYIVHVSCGLSCDNSDTNPTPI